MIRVLKVEKRSRHHYAGMAEVFFAFFPSAARRGAGSALTSHHLTGFIPPRSVAYPAAPRQRAAYCLSQFKFCV